MTHTESHKWNDEYTSLDVAWNQVKHFHQEGKHPIGHQPHMLDHDRLIKRIIWMEEEIHELTNAQTVVDQTDALLDLMYFALGTFVEMGIKPAQLFDIVHSANMTKVQNYILKKDDTKIGKPEGWVRPEEKLEQLIQQQADSTGNGRSTQLDLFPAE